MAVCAKIAAALVSAGFNGLGISENVWAVAVLAIVAVTGIWLAVAGRGRFVLSAAMVWGLVWIAVAR